MYVLDVCWVSFDVCFFIWLYISVASFLPILPCACVAPLSYRIRLVSTTPVHRNVALGKALRHYDKLQE